MEIARVAAFIDRRYRLEVQANRSLEEPSLIALVLAVINAKLPLSMTKDLFTFRDYRCDESVPHAGTTLRNEDDLRSSSTVRARKLIGRLSSRPFLFLIVDC